MSVVDTILNFRTTQPKVLNPDTLSAGPESGVASAGLSDKIVDARGNPYVPGPCNDNSQSSGTLTTATLVIPMNNFTNSFDNQLEFPKSCRRLTIASAGDNAVDEDAEYNAFAISLTPTGLKNSVGIYDVRGTEPWIPLPGGLLNLAGVTMEFDTPVSRIFFHVLSEEVGGTNLIFDITFILDGVKVTFQPVPTGE